MAGFAEAEAELKRAWDSESSSVAEGTMGGMRRPDKALSPDGAVHLRTVSAFQQSPTSPVSVWLSRSVLLHFSFSPFPLRSLQHLLLSQMRAALLYTRQ